MTVEEKRTKVQNYCLSVPCDKCKLRVGDWEKPNGTTENTCVYIMEASEKDLNRALVLIGEIDELSINECREAISLPTINNESPISPTYYNDTKIAPIDVIEDWDLDFCLGSALKYIKRCGKKENNPSVQDLKKVIWYIERRIKELEEATNEREN